MSASLTELEIAVFAGETGTHLLDEPRSPRFGRFRARFDEAAYRRELEAGGLRFVARSEPAFPGRLRAIHDPPPGLFVRGEQELALLERPCVAVVGARSCSPYGTAVALAFGRELAAAGVVVVSGLARGVDAAAHRGALDAGQTVAVLGCGVDRDYPRAHATLASAVAGSGLIVSEYPPGVEPAPWRFPARNRIVAGLSVATVVVEARERSGALITADLALEEGREVLAVPGEITSHLSRGTNALLRLGATPATCVEDVLDAIGVEPAPEERPALGERLEAVRAAVADAPATADEVARALGVGSGEAAAALAELELLGLVSSSEGLYRSAVGRRTRPSA